MRIWLDPDKLDNFGADAARRRRGDPGAERAGLRRPDRRPARACRASSSTPPSSARPVCRRPSEFRDILAARESRRLAAAPRRRRARRARRRELRPRHQVQRQAGRRHGRSGSRPAPTRSTPSTRSRRRSTALRRSFRPASKPCIPLDTTPFVRMSIEEVVQDAGRGDRARVPRDVPVPAEPARDADPDHRGAGRAARHVRRAGGVRLLDQHAHHVRHGARRSACWSTTRSSWSRTSSA